MGFLGWVTLAQAQGQAPGRAAKGEAARAKLAAGTKAREGARATAARREARVDRRQDRQDRRIEHGIRKGYLTTEEIAKLEAQQKSIADLEASLKADGKLTRDEMKQLKTALDAASQCIWAEKHDTEGNQMPVFRFGRNVFAKDSVTALLSQEDLPVDQAKAIIKDFHHLMGLKRKLSTDELSADERAKLQGEYNDLLNKYFELRAPAANRPAK